MDTFLPALPPHPTGEQPPVEEFSATADTFAGRVHVEWDSSGLVTPLGQLPFFIEYLKQAGLFVMRGLTPDDTRRAIGTVCPNVLFPYARVAVSQLVTQGGFPNFVLPPVDFDQLFARGLAQQAAAPAQGPAN